MKYKLTRRHLLGIAGLGGAGFNQTVAQGGRPNVLFLFADDQRFDTIRALGNREIETPNLDGLVHRGVAFTHAHITGGSAPAVCVATRAMLLTGRPLYRVPRSMSPEGQADGNRPPIMFPELMRQAGYSTFGIGKWHNGPASFARCFGGGAEIFYGGMSDHYKVPVADFDPAGKYPAAGRRTSGKFSSELFSDAAVRFLRAYRGNSPFCLYVAYTAPHDPRTVPKEYRERYTPSKIALPRNFLAEHPFDNGEMKVRDELLEVWPRTPQAIRGHIADYYAMITHLDAQIGRVLGALEETGRSRDTIVVYAGDNGLALGQHGLMGKQSVYDHSVRVPLVVAGPGVPRDVRRERLCYLMDVFPTLCDLTGLPVPDSVEARSLLPCIRDPRVRGRDSLLLAYRHFQRGVRTERWKLIVYNVDGKRTTQLFDLRRDPWETRNLAGNPSHASRVRELTAMLREWMRKTGDPVELDAPVWSAGTV